MHLWDLVDAAIKGAREAGASFAEARLEDVTLRILTRENREFRDSSVVRRQGLGIAAYVGGAVGYSYASGLEPGAVRAAARRAVAMARSSSAAAELGQDPGSLPPLRQRGLRPPMGIPPGERPIEEKASLVREASEAALEHGRSITSVVAAYGEMTGRRIIANSEGREVEWFPSVVDLRVSVTSRDAGGGLVEASDAFGGSLGLEAFRDGHDPRALGENAARWAAEKIGARAAPAGEFRALCENRLVGVLAHESFGHMTEADFILTGTSPLAGRIGEALGSEHASIVDEGAVDNRRFQPFWIPVDDQGTETRRTVLLDRGVLRGYLHSRQTAVRLGMEPTGNARAINLYYPPIPRMRNTYFLPGDLAEEEALEALGTGIYAIRTAGGQVSLDGTFFFKAVRGYWVEKGEPVRPLKDVILTGNMLQFLQRVEGGTRDLEIGSGYFGGCGKGRQYPLPVGLGGPKLLISGVRFGGERG